MKTPLKILQQLSFLFSFSTKKKICAKYIHILVQFPLKHFVSDWPYLFSYSYLAVEERLSYLYLLLLMLIHVSVKAVRTRAFNYRWANVQQNGA